MFSTIGCQHNSRVPGDNPAQLGELTHFLNVMILCLMSPRTKFESCRHIVLVNSGADPCSTWGEEFVICCVDFQESHVIGGMIK